MAFLAALPELAEAGGAAEAAGGAEAGESGGMLSRLFSRKPAPGPGDANKQQGNGESRTLNFVDAAQSVRGALRGGVD